MSEISPQAPALAGSLPPRWRRVLSVLLLLHCCALVVAPASVPPTSLMWDDLWWFFRPYLQFCYLNHGYKFFAPEPGPSTLLAFTVELSDGSTVQETIPNRSIHPRLLYHRHFMLTEFLNFAPENWHETYARHLCRKYGAESVSLSRMTRLLPTMEEIRDGGTLTDPSRYLETPLGSFRCDEL